MYFYEADYEASNKSHSEALTIQLKHAGAEAEYTQSIMEVIAFSLLHQSGVDLAHNIVRHPRTDIAKHRSAVAYAKALPLIESRARKLDDLSASQAQAVDHYCSKQAVNLLRELLTSGYMNADTLMNSPEFVSLHAIPDYQLLFN